MFSSRFAAFTVGMALAALAFAPSAAHAQANLTFTGGNGVSPITLTLNAPVTYTITTDIVTDISFLFNGVGGTGGFVSTGSGTIRYQVNNGPLLSFTSIGNATEGGDITTDDVYLSSQTPLNLVAGNTVTLLPGTFTTSITLPGALPSGSFSTFIITNNGGTRISNVVPAPEPASAALALPFAVGIMAASRRRKGV